MAKSKCIDSGSEYCPCYLAETNDCLVCTHLQGKGFCDCSWSGVCIYQDFSWCGQMMKDYRNDLEGIIIGKEKIGNKGSIYNIKVSKTLARQLKHPGSYIFVRDFNKPFIFNVPMSIMSSDEFTGIIEIAVETLGVKTKSLMDCSERLLIKGPFWNGIHGLKYLKNTDKDNVLIVARGIALAPSLLVVNYLKKKNNNITFLMDTGKIGEAFIDDRLKDLEIDVIPINLRTQEGLEKIRTLLRTKKFKLVFSGGADKLHRLLINELDSFDNCIELAATNNSPLCCGEGICGSCVNKTSQGEYLKMCKCQLDVREALGKVER